MINTIITIAIKTIIMPQFLLNVALSRASRHFPSLHEWSFSSSFLNYFSSSFSSVTVFNVYFVWSTHKPLSQGCHKDYPQMFNDPLHLKQAIFPQFSISHFYLGSNASTQTLSSALLVSSCILVGLAGRSSISILPADIQSCAI